MRTWSWTHDFESYLYWWPITGTSIIRDAGKEKNKAIKGESGRGRVTNLILTKLKGYSTQKQQNYESNFDCNLIAPSHRGPPNPMMHHEGWKELNTGSNDDKESSIFHLFTKGKKHIEFSVDEPPLPCRGRRVSDADGVLVNHSNDSQTRWLHKETHVCSPLFKRLA